MWKRMLQLSNGNQEEPSGGPHNGPHSRMAVLEPEESGARPAATAAAKWEHPPALLTDFEQIYQGGATKPPRLAYGVLKVAEMLGSVHLSGMPAEAKRRALLMALEASSAKVEDILQDAIVRQRLINDYEEARQADLQSFEAATLEQNRAIQAELDRLTSQYVARMQANLDAVGRAQDSFRMWQKRKQQEAQRIADAAACCVPEAGAQSTAAGGGLTLVLERASSAAAR